MRPSVAYLLFALGAVLVAIAYAPQQSSAYQHVRNGGFENGLSGWSVAPTTNADATDEGAPPEGVASARIVVGESDAVMRQRLSGALAAGTYGLQIAARSDERVVLTISVLLADTPQQLVVVSSQTESAWNEVGGTFVLYEAREAIVSIVASGAPGASVYIDDIRLDGAAPITITPTATPAPPTLTPEVAGAALTATRVASATPQTTATPAIVDVISADIRNGGFEDVDEAGLPFAWAKYGGTLSSDGRARGGVRAARLESATTSTKWLHQAVSVDGGSWYKLDAWVLQADPGVAAAFLRISWYASADASGEALATDDSTARLESAANAYRPLTTGAVQAPAEARSARVRLMLAPVSSAHASIVVDDVGWSRVVAPPASPASASPTLAASNSIDNETRGPRDGSQGGSARTGGRAASLISGDGFAQGGARVAINEIMYDAAGDVPDGDAEWVELFNANEEPVVLSGWSLGDAARTTALPAVTLPAKGFAIVAASEAFRVAYPSVTAPVVVVSGRIGNGLGNDGDRLSLFDQRGTIVDAVSWGDDTSAFAPSIEDAPEGHSLERRLAGIDSDSAADFVDNERPSPGSEYSGLAVEPQSQGGSAGAVEILDGAAGRDWDWVAWAIAAASIAGCAGVGGWRAAFAVRDRLRHS